MPIPRNLDRIGHLPAALVYGAARSRPRNPHRDASFWAVKTPGVILDEMRAAKTEIESLGRDIYATFRRSFEAQLTAAEQRFVTTYGRKAGVGHAARDDDDQTVRSFMQPPPTDADWQHKSYQGAFVYQWSELEREFDAFWAEHAHSWTDRMWRGTYDRSVEYRRRALAWRQRFIDLGGQPTAPAPTPPTEEILPGISFSWKTIAVVGGIALGAILPGISFSWKTIAVVGGIALGALVLVPAVLQKARGS